MKPISSLPRGLFRQYYLFLKKNIIFLAFLFYLPFLFRNAVVLYGKWPTNIWEEIFISYAGGFVRRGLTGEILYYLYSLGVNIRVYALVCVVAFSIAFLLFCFYFVKKNIDIVPALFIILSPGIFIFGFIDLGDFARRDWLIAMFFILMMLAAQNDGILSRILICLLACFGLLFHEALFFYLPMPFMLLYASRPREKNFYGFLLFASMFFFSVLVLIFLFSGTVAQRQMMEMEWRNLIPDFSAKHLMLYIGGGLKEVSPWLTLKFFQLKSITGIILGLVLTLSPIAWWAMRIGIPAKLRLAYPRWWERCLLLGAVLSPCGLMLLENDFGRRISLFAIELLFFLVFFCKMRGLPTRERADERVTGSVFLLLLLTSFTWKMRHWTDPGQSILTFVPSLLILFILFSFLTFMALAFLRKLLPGFENCRAISSLRQKLRFLEC